MNSPVHCIVHEYCTASCTMGDNTQTVFLLDIITKAFCSLIHLSSDLSIIPTINIIIIRLHDTKGDCRDDSISNDHNTGPT